MIKTSSSERSPREDEQQYVESAKKTLEQVRSYLSDETLEKEFGPGAVREVHVCWLPRVGWMHLACVKSRAGDIIAFLHIALAQKKANLPLYVAAKLEKQRDRPLLQRVLPNVTAIDFVVLDFDKGDAEFAAVVAKLIELKIGALVYRSPSDGTTETKILRCSGELGPGSKELCAPTIEAVRARLLRDGYKAENIEPFQITDDASVERNRKRVRNVKSGKWETREIVKTFIVIRHPPLAKTRIVVPLARTFTRREGERGAAFSDRYTIELAEPIVASLGFVADEACFDAVHPYYVPSSICPSAVADPGVNIVQWVPGEWLDPYGSRMSEIRDAYVEPREEKAAALKVEKERRRTERVVQGRSTPVGRYALADLLAEHCHHVTADKRDDKDLVECDCPFGDEHSNGDPGGFFATNSGVARCHHHHNGRRDEADDFVPEMLELGWITSEQLEQYRLTDLARRYQPPFTSPTKKPLSSWGKSKPQFLR